MISTLKLFQISSLCYKLKCIGVVLKKIFELLLNILNGGLIITGGFSIINAFLIFISFSKKQHVKIKTTETSRDKHFSLDFKFPTMQINTK